MGTEYERERERERLRLRECQRLKQGGIENGSGGNVCHITDCRVDKELWWLREERRGLTDSG